jgi:hypothetical protein
MNISYELSEEQRLLKEHDIDPICRICFNYIEDAATIGLAESCSHYFCHFCLLSMDTDITNKRFCPICRANKSYHITRIEAINHIIKNIKIKCKDSRCNSIFTISERNNHEKNCEYFISKCKFYLCNFKGTKEVLNNHEISCKYKKICKRCCQEMKSYELNYNEHISISCPEIFIKCYHTTCKKYVRRKYMRSHLISHNKNH